MRENELLKEELLELKKRLSTLATLSKVATIISSKITLKELTYAVVDHLGKVLKNDRVNLVLYHSQTEVLEFIASFISGEIDNKEAQTYPLSDGMNSWIVKNSKPLLCKKDTVAECKEYGIRHGGKPAKSWLGVPIIHDGKTLGVLSVQSYDTPMLYDETSIELLDLVAGQVAVTIENARLYETITKREAEKQKLYYSLSHDLLGFISPVLGFSEIIKRINPEEFLEKQSEISEALASCAGRVTSFVEDILIFSKLQSGKLILNKEQVDIYSIISRSIANYQLEIEMRNLSIFIDGEDVSSSKANFSGKLSDIDQLQMERVLNNILHNAIKHANGKIDISTSTENGFIICSVKDDGQGMDASLSTKVFDEYFQSETGKNKGVGLGLPSVKSIVELHGGKVDIKTSLGKGFEFLFWIKEA